MKAMILAAGYGSRLGELTKETPKCLMPIGETTLLELLVNQLKEFNVSEIIINLYHLAQKVDCYVKGRNSFDTQVFLSKEEVLLGTGGGVLKVADRLKAEECFVIYNADIYSEVDLHQMVSAHIQHDALVTLAVMNRETSRPLFFDKNMYMCNDKETTKQPFGFTGIHVVSPRVFDYFTGFGQSFSIIDPYRRAVDSGERIVGFDIGSTYWIDAGVPARLEALRNYLLRSPQNT